MKLVEILARGWAEWPQALVSAFQEKDGAIWGNMWFDYKHALGIVNIADDWETALITRGQWQAERNRMNKMEALIEARDNLPSTEPTYEQQLWDRVASSAICGIVASSAFHNYQNFQGNVANAVDFASQVADAFMAERAKRVGK